MIMNLILALLLITLEAVFEGLKIAGHHVASEIVEAVYLVMVSLIDSSSFGLNIGEYLWIRVI
jgi:hypothetical protein